LSWTTGQKAKEGDFFDDRGLSYRAKCQRDQGFVLEDGDEELNRLATRMTGVVVVVVVVVGEEDEDEDEEE
jgi:hypothetical protein